MPAEDTAMSTSTGTTAAETTTSEIKTAETTAQTNILADAETKTIEAAPTETKTAEGEKKEGEEEKKPETKAPEEYKEFKLPEGQPLDEKGMSEFKGLAKELDLTQDQAQKLLDFGGERIKQQLEAPYKLWAETQAKWQKEVKDDPDIGGTKFEESIKTAAKVFEPGESNPFVGRAEEGKALREALNMTGAGNNPAIVKMFVKIGRLLSEPGGLTGKPVGVNDQGSLLDKMYPTMNKDGAKPAG